MDLTATARCSDNASSDSHSTARDGPTPREVEEAPAASRAGPQSRTGSRRLTVSRDVL